ncbi:MAG: protein kinase [Acidobacteriota bacterium]|nr:protein kinase [Acidobacteriota bacterium]
MTLSTGTRLGPYEILAPLGAGGMGEVYRARDTRLGREVAIKVLPSPLASDPERLKRFEREARAASSLNHPNIVTIYDIGSADSVSYIAMELVNGELLRTILLEGALPVRRLLQIGAQIAEGLAKAHVAGIVHRDLKPENVMVTEDGLVKILDFGLAKLTQPDSSGSGRTQAPTVSGATEEGVILGTVGYMSPEQASGGSIDYRSDQFSFGSILYEMTTGRRAFVRASAPETLTAIIREEPEPISATEPKVPTPLRWIVERCLAKQPKSRYTSTEDLARDLATVRDRLSETTSAAEVAAPVAVSGRRPWWIPAVIAAGLLMALGIVGWNLRLRGYFWKNPLAGAHFTRLTDWEGSELDAAISADGKFVAFLSDRDGPYDAFMLQVGSGEFLNLTKGQFPELVHEQVRSVGFSGDGAFVWLGVRERDPDGKNNRAGVWLVPTMGGAPRPFIAPQLISPNAPPGEKYGPGGMLAVWSPDGSRILSHESGPGDPIFTTDRAGGDRKYLFKDSPGSHCHFPIWSPDGRFVYFVRGTAAINDMDLWRIPIIGGEPERLTHHNSRVAYPTFVDERTLVYTATAEDGSGSGIYAMDVERRISHRVSFGLEEYISVSASADGRRLAATVANPVRNLWSVPITGQIVEESAVARFPLPTALAVSPRFGPGYVLYLSSRGGSDGLWKFQKGAATELWKPSQGFLTSAPSISRDGTQVCFSIRRLGRSQLYVMAADGTNARSLAESLDVRDSASWSPDGQWIVAAVNEGRGKQNLFKIPVNGGPPIRLVEGVAFNPVWSPDGKLIVYCESLSGNLYRVKAITAENQPFPLPELWVRSDWDRYRFLPGGKSLVLLMGQFRRQDFWHLDLASGTLRQLTRLRPGYSVRGFDVSPDGTQILFDRYRENSDVVLIDLPPR